MITFSIGLFLWLSDFRFVQPSETTISGRTTFQVAVGYPPDEVLGLELFINDAHAHYFEEPPYTVELDLNMFPKGEIQVKAVLELYDGSKKELILAGTNLGVDLEAAVRLVRVPVQVSQQGRPLDLADFQLFENDQDQRLVSVAGESKPLYLLVVLDLSGSMANRLLILRNSLYALIDRVRPGDIVHLVGFNHRVFELCPPESDMDVVRSSLAHIEAKGDTNIYGAVWSGLKSLSRTRERRALLLFTDGDHTVLEEDDAYKKNLQDCVDSAMQAGVPVYAIGFGVKINRKNLEELCQKTGGKAFFQETPKKLADKFVAVGDELRRQYLLGYHSQAKRGWQAIRVVTEVANQGLHYPQRIYIDEK